MEEDLNKTPFKFVGVDIQEVHKLFWNIFKCSIKQKDVTGVIIFTKKLNDSIWLLYTSTGKIAIFELNTFPEFTYRIPPNLFKSLS